MTYRTKNIVAAEINSIFAAEDRKYLELHGEAALKEHQRKRAAYAAAKPRKEKTEATSLLGLRRN